MVRWNKAYIKGTHNIVGIDDECSVKLEYECMACGSAMIAKRGQKRIHHFAHKENNVKCDPESYFHKLGKRIFKEVYDESANFKIKTTTRIIDLKKGYGECLIEVREEGQILKKNADLLIKHLTDEKKDILVEIFYSHQVNKKKIDSANRIIEIRIPISWVDNENVESDTIESEVRQICTPPLCESDNVRFFNFEDNVIYQEIQPISIHKVYFSDDECLGTDIGIKHIHKFKKYESTRKFPNSGNEQGIENKEEYNDDAKHNFIESVKAVSSLKPRMEAITSTNYFDVDDLIKKKYPNIKHQPAVLPSHKNIIDIIVKDGIKEYWLGIDYRKREVFEGDLERKIPAEWRLAVREYIKNLKRIK